MSGPDADRDLFGEPVLREERRARTPVPPWFTVPTSDRYVRAHLRNVQRGLHPFGFELSTVPGALCGNCAHLYLAGGGARDYMKCRLNENTNGPATDLRAKWRACSSWRVAPPGADVPRKRPGPPGSLLAGSPERS